MKKRFTTKLSNAVEPAAPTATWNYKGCAGKGGNTRNSTIAIKSDKKEND